MHNVCTFLAIYGKNEERIPGKGKDVIMITIILGCRKKEQQFIFAFSVRGTKRSVCVEHIPAGDRFP